MANRRAILLFAVLFSASITCSRYIIVLLHRVNAISHDYLFKFILSSIAEFTVGFLLGVILFTFKRKILFHAFFIIVVGTAVLVEVTSFHYEAVFGRLPAADLFFYTSELKNLSPSLAVNLPFANVLIESLIILLVIYGGLKLSGAENPGTVPGWITMLTMIVILISVTLQSVPSLLSDRYIWSSRQPLLWLAQSALIKESFRAGDMQLTEKEFNNFRRLHGIASRRPLLDPEYPLCLAQGPVQHNGNGRNVIVLILEGVGRREMNGIYEGMELMPNLKRIAAENLSYQHVYAPGTKSVTLLPAVFSGLPGNPYNNYLWNSPPINLTGIPAELDRVGYETAYFHGGDLSFEHQRPYLKRIGFRDIYEYDPALKEPVYGWGFSDEFMFQRLKQWISERQPEQGRFFTSLFTLSTHDPYILPPDWRRRLPEEDGVWPKFVETYFYLDYYLGQFYDWYKKNTADTLLVITGDHAAHIIDENKITEAYEMRFDVPLVIAGLTSDEIKMYKQYRERTASSYDIPATLMDLLGLPPPSCGLGVSLIRPDEGRVVYAFGGDALERMHMWLHGQEVVFDRIRNQFRLVNPEDRTMQAIGDNTLFARARQFIDQTYPVDYYLLNENKYSPPVLRTKKKNIQGLPRPVVASHRGNTNGEGTNQYENSSSAIDKVLESSFKWVEIDIQLTSDGQLILFHDPFIEQGNNRKPLLELTLDEIRSIPGYADVLTLQEALDRYADQINLLIEIKPQEQTRQLEYLNREVVRILSAQSDKSRFIVDSFNPYIASSVKHGCGCEVGYDTDFEKKLDRSDLEYAAQMEVDWIYVHYSIVDSDLIRLAHEYGLKVMAYTVDDKKIIEAWKNTGLLPDGIITDYEKINDNLNTMR